jgi:hypothetical protein
MFCRSIVLCSVAFLELFKWPRAADTLLEGRMLARTALETKMYFVLFYAEEIATMCKQQFFFLLALFSVLLVHRQRWRFLRPFDAAVS